MKTKHLLFLILALVSMGGCAPAKVSLRQSFWEDKSPRIGVALAPVPEAGTHLYGLPLLQQGIIHSANKMVRESMGENLDVSRFEEVRDRFVKRLSEKGFNAKALPEVVYKKETAAEIASANNVDTLLLITVKSFGTLRKYVTILFVPAPSGPPKGLFDVEGQMVSLPGGETLWRAVMEKDAPLVEIEEPWDQKDEEYPNVVKAVHAAADNAARFLAEDFFGKDVAWGPVDLSAKK